MSDATLSHQSLSQTAQIAKADLAALLLRASMGVLFLVHAGIKIFVFTPAGTVGYFASLGLPAVLAYAVIMAELFGGLALLLGLWTRWVSLALLPVLLGAIFLSHGAKGFLFSNPGGG